MNLEDTIRLLIEKTGLSRNELMKKINEKKEEMDGLMTDEGAAYLIAKDFSIDLDLKLGSSKRPIIQIKDLDVSKTIVNLVGRVSKVFNVKTFIRKKDNKEGRVGSFILEDKTGQIRVVLWDNQTEIIETHQIEEGMPIYIENAKLRSGQNGLEIHIGSRSRIDDPPESLSEFIPDKIDVYNINQLKDGMRGINIRGVISWIGEIKTFQRKDGSYGQVIPLIIRDETGSIRCSIWNEKADDILNYKVGDSIKLTDVNVTQSDLGNLEVRAHINTVISRIPNFMDLNRAKGIDFKINELNVSSRNVNVKFKVIEKVDEREIISKSGDKYKVADFLVADETGCIKLTAWNEDIEKIKEGKTYQVINGYINEFRGTISLSTGKFGEIKELDEEIQRINLDNDISNSFNSDRIERKNIIDLKNGDYVQIRGAIVNIIMRRPLYDACPICFKKVNSDGSGNWICPKCGKIDKKVDRMLWSFILDDGTGNVRVTVAGSLAEDLLGLDVIATRKVMEQKCFGEAPLVMMKDQLLGKEIVITGRVNYNSNFDWMEIFASAIEEADPIQEGNILIEQLNSLNN